MAAVLITPATVDVVSVADVKAHLRIDYSDDDAYLGALTLAAAATTESWLGIALRPQTWELRDDAFPSAEIILPRQPVIEIESVKYDDSDGVEQTVDDADYRLYVDGSVYGVEPVYGGSWPSARNDRGSVRVRFIAGYEIVDGVDPLPPPIKVAIMQMVSDLYQFRETASAAAITEVPMSLSATRLLAPYRQINL